MKLLLLCTEDVIFEVETTTKVFPESFESNEWEKIRIRNRPLSKKSITLFTQFGLFSSDAEIHTVDCNRGIVFGRHALHNEKVWIIISPQIPINL